MKKIGCIILFLCLCAVGGCGKKEDVNTEKSHETTLENSSLDLETLKEEGHIEKQLTDGVLLDADVIFPECEIDEIKSCAITNGSFHGKKLAAELFPQIAEDQWQYPDYSELGAESTALYYGEYLLGETETSCQITIGPPLYFSTKHWQMCEMMFPIRMINGIVDDMGNELDEDFAFATREEIEKRAKTYLEESVGLSGIELVRTYSMNHQQMQEQYQEYASNPELQMAGKEGEFTQTEWTETEDCYWVVMEQGIHGIPILRHPYARQDEMSLPTGGVEMGYTSQGLEYIRISNLFEVTEEVPVKLAELETVLEALEKKYEMTFYENVVLDEMQLVYFPYPRLEGFEYDLIPAWAFRVQMEDYIDYVYVDAVSGKEIAE